MFKKPLLIAEIGGNHQGDFGKAKELVHMALDCDVDFVKVLEVAGSENKAPTQSEIENNHLMTFRRGAYLKRRLSSGAIIVKDDLIEKRPINGGLAFLDLIGKTVNKDLAKGQFLLERDISE